MQDELIAFVPISTNDARRQFRKLNFNSSQLLIQMMIITTLGILLTVSINLISPTSQRPFQQYVFGQESTNVSSLTSDKTSTGLTFPQIHNFTSTPPAPVNSWII